MIASGKIGNVKISDCTIPSLLEAVRLHTRKLNGSPFRINCLNAHLFNMCADDAELRRLINDSDIVAADGMSIVWAARLFGIRMESRCNMTEAFRAYMLSADMPPVNVVLLGGSADVAAAVAEVINAQCEHCHVTGTYSGYLEDVAYERLLREQADIDLVLLGMGSPKSERIGALAAQVCRHAVIWHIGGGTLTFMAGVLPEAPRWMRRCGLQWLHRLLREPRRLWRRYLLGNPRFLWLLWQSRP